MRKTISLFLVFSLLTSSIPLTAKEKKGADLIVQKTDGAQVRGELIAVKESSLLLMERDSGVDVSVDIKELGVITIAKKSKLLRGAGLGFLIGAGTGAIYMAVATNVNDSRFGWMGLSAAVVGSAGALLGLLIVVISGTASKTTKTIQIEGKSDSEIQEILERLRKKARIKNAQ